MKRCKICKKVLGFCIVIDKNGKERGTCDKCNLEMENSDKKATKIPIEHAIRADVIVCDKGGYAIDVKEFVDYILNELDAIKANQQKILSAINGG